MEGIKKENRKFWKIPIPDKEKIFAFFSSLFPPEKRKQAILGGSLFFLGGVLLLVENLSLRSKVEGRKMVEIVIAKQNLPKGSEITEGGVTTRLFPEEYLPPKAIRSEEKKWIFHRKLFHGVKKGEPILWGDLEPSATGENRLSGFVRFGERAVAIPVDSLVTLGYELTPGDRVDLFLVTRRTTGQVVIPILQNVTILSVGGSFPGETPPPQYDHIILSLTPREAEAILLAQEIGKIHLLLRNENDVEMVEEFPVLDEFEFLGGGIRKEIQEQRKKREEERIRIFRGQG